MSLLACLLLPSFSALLDLPDHALGARFVDQGLPLAVVGVFQQRQQARAELVLQGSSW